MRTRVKEYTGYDERTIQGTSKMNTRTTTKNIAIFLVITFIGASILIMPVYGTTVEAGSNIGMSVVNMRTTTSAGFVVSGYTPVELTHNVRITDLNGVPSQGKVTTFMQGIIQEGRGSASVLFAMIEFKESASIDGRISLFDKDMRYTSDMAR
jgi:hypothetical protein